ncbi:hypothetical protein IMG5_135700 [Ichthyophthirius multifiliis]|uniref:Arginase n=1 Tax=Ichthyophthirius multifiliis TaxID=5932 RepID=G0QWW2_ICHMU|nr:hypothetical protein IMG5_135700 [Ichthyophthirius multifiliis]EGR30304.1 hypothetical protein IMG5_135700 [Ichthyophthirius multifiliis]|eukprot:XP_004031891.1 hypothetical protein IMG5_135700 [Ichthyophthirius multifiliis]
MNQKQKYIEKFQKIKTKNIDIIGVCIKEGQNLTGTELAPDCLRKSGLNLVLEFLGWKINDLGNINLESQDEGQEVHTKIENKTNQSQDDKQDLQLKYYTNMKHSETIGQACQQLHEKVKQSSQKSNFPLILGGDHGIATGTISGMLETYENLKVIWIDAHGDINLPETSPSGNYHGMPVAHLLGWFQKKVKGFDWLKFKLKPENIVFIGLRDLDEEEKDLLNKNKIKCFCMHQIDQFGIGEVMKQAFKYLKIDEDQNSALHLSFDIDAVDPSFAPGTGTKSKGGLTYREAHYICRSAAESGKLVSMELVEVNPNLEEVDHHLLHLHGDDKNIKGSKTVGLAIELIKSALGYTLL